MRMGTNQGADERLSLAIAARRLKSKARHRAKNILPALFLMTDEERAADPRVAVLHLPRGSGVILRHYGARNRADLAVELAAICRRRGVVLLVARDPALAHKVRAAGLHLPEHALARAPVARLRNAFSLLTAAAHDERAVHRANAAGVDAILISPVFPTQSHPGRPHLGAVRLAKLVRLAHRPVIALGGLDRHTASRLQGSGVAGLAAIGALMPAGLPISSVD